MIREIKSLEIDLNRILEKAGYLSSVNSKSRKSLSLLVHLVAQEGVHRKMSDQMLVTCQLKRNKN